MDILTVQSHRGADYHRAKDIPAKRHTKNSAQFSSTDKAFISVEDGRGTVIICDLLELNACISSWFVPAERTPHQN